MTGVRQVVTRSPDRRVGFASCPWFRSDPIEYESLLERDFVRLALLDLQISSISEQPFVLDLGELGAYTPDFLLKGPNLKTVVEVKPKVFANNRRNAPRLKRADELLGQKGYRFMVATEEFIHADKRHVRAAILLRHARSHLSAEVTARVLAIASRFPRGIQIGKLASSAEVPKPTVLHLVARRNLRIAPSLILDDSELVYPIGGCDDNLHA
jgi:hypothetical protein